MVHKILVNYKTCNLFVRHSDYSFCRDDISYSNHVPNAASHGGKLFNIMKELLYDNKILEIMSKYPNIYKR